MVVTVNVKPLSVNEAWKGRRYKTDKYIQYEMMLLYLLPIIEIPEPPFEIYFKFGFSNKASDWDNPIKQTQDIICKKYKINDKLIRRAVIDTEIVKKGEEYIKFELKTLK